MSFGSELRQVLNICHVKMTSLANCLGYDISYISKWISGSKSPAEGSIESICGKIAGYCLSGATEKEVRVLQKHIGVPNGTSMEKTIQPLAEYLMASYMLGKVESESARSIAAGSFERTDVRLDNNWGDCLEHFLRNVLSENHSDELEIIISAVTFLEASKFLSEFTKEFPGRRLIMHVFYDPQSFPSPDEYCHFIFNVCSKSNEIEADISEVKINNHESCDLLCIVRNCGMLVKAPGILGNFPAYTFDVIDVNYQYDIATSMLHGRKFDSYSYGDSQYERYLFKFYSPKDSTPIGILTDEMLVPSWDSISDDEVKSDLIRHGSDIERLTWYARLTNSGAERINYLYYESGIIDFCRNGSGRMGPDDYEPVIFSPESRRLLLEKVILSIESGEKTMYILSDINPVLNWKDFNGTIAYNGGLVCVIPAGSRKVTYIKTPFVVDSFKSLFESLLALPDNYLLHGEKTVGFLRYAMSFIP